MCFLGTTRRWVGRLRVDVVERHDALVAVGRARRPAACGDLAEETGHGAAHSVHRPASRRACDLRVGGLRSAERRGGPADALEVDLLDRQRQLRRRAGRPAASSSPRRPAAPRPRPASPSGSARGRRGRGREARAVALERDAPESDRVARANGERARDDAQAVALAQLAREVGQALRLERGLRHLPHAAEEPSLRPAHEQHAAVLLDEGGGDGHVDRRAAGAALRAARRRAPAACARQCLRTGQAGHAGLRGRQTVAPSSITAWFQSPGRSRSSSSSARL